MIMWKRDEDKEVGRNKAEGKRKQNTSQEKGKGEKRKDLKRRGEWVKVRGKGEDTV
jgi:hypothetical protein